MYPGAVMKVSVVGTGYVGLVAAAVFADYGNDVLCSDIDAAKIDSLRQGKVPIFEPGLDDLVAANMEAGRLRFSTSNVEAAQHGEVIFLAVGTPGRSDGSANVDGLLAAAREIAAALDHRAVIVNKSTVPIGTAERVRQIFAEYECEVSVASNPEFLKEGSAVNDFMRPDRVIIGTSDDFARGHLTRLYQAFFRTSERILHMDPRSAEVTKYACNAYLATRVSYINAIANLCDAVGANVESVRKGMGSDPRIGNKFLFPGVGYGGSCFPKDTRALITTASEHGVELDIVRAAERVNDGQKHVLVTKVFNHFGSNLDGKIFALWGLAFKPNTDDVREAPALTIAAALQKAGAQLRVCDPQAGPAFMANLEDTQRITLEEDPYEATRDAHGLLLVTEWRQFRSPDFQRLRQTMAQPALFDGRNQWQRSHVEALGFYYTGIGR